MSQTILFCLQFGNLASSGIDSIAAIGCVLVLSAILGALMTECLGRRILLIASSLIMTFSQLILAILFTLYYSDLYKNNSLHPIFYGLFLMSFAFGLGPVSFTLYGELFNVDAQSIVGPVSMTIYFLINSVMSKVIEFVYKEQIDPLRDQLLLYLFTAGSALLGIFTYFFVPETLGKSLLETHIDDLP